MRGKPYNKTLIIIFLAYLTLSLSCGSDDGRHVRDVSAAEELFLSD